MSKIVVVFGSPRKNGNTMSMVKIFEENVKKIDINVEFEYVYLIDRDLQYCRGCCVCLRCGGENCPIKDDAADILKTMHSADGLVFACPGYAHMVPGLFKNFIDRFMYLDHLPEFVGVPAVIITTVGGDGIRAIPRYIANMAVSWWGCNVIDKIGIGHAFFILNKKYKNKTNKKLKNSAQRFYKEINDKSLKKPTFLQYLFFMFNKTETELALSAMPARAKYWKDRGWFEADYYYKIKVNFLYKCICFFLFGIFKFVFRSIIGKDTEKALQYYLSNY